MTESLTASRSPRRCIVTLALLAAAAALPVQAQSGASRASQNLSEASVALPSASVELLAAGGAFSVVALRPVGASVEVVLASAADGARISLQVARELVTAAGIAVGVTLSATVVAGGYLIWAGSEAIAFVAEPSLAPHIHRQALTR